MISYILSAFLYLFELITNSNTLKQFAISLFLGIFIYLLIATIYCSVFRVSYVKFFKYTIFPVIGMIILIIQGIIYIFFIPYHIYVVIKDTFHHIIQIITIFFNWISDIINTTLNIEDYILNS